jgi:hypothetical protein
VTLKEVDCIQVGQRYPARQFRNLSREVWKQITCSQQKVFYVERQLQQDLEYLL